MGLEIKPIAMPRTSDPRELRKWREAVAWWVPNSNIGIICPEWFGAKGDGVTDDGPSIRAAIAAAASGDTIVFPNGAYYVSGTTGIQITTAINIEMAMGSKLVFDDDDTEYVKYTGVTGVSVVGLTIDAGTPSVRGNEPALYFLNCNETFVDRFKVVSAAGAGYLVYGGNEHHIQNSHVEGTLADGYHWTNKATRFTAANLTSENTGDDSFAIVGYLANGGRVANGNLTGLVSRGSAANGLRISGGENIIADVVVDTCTGHGVIVQEDGVYSTYSSQFCKIDAVVDSPTLNGVCITEDANDIIVHAIVNNGTVRGWNIGGSGKTIKRITVSGEANGCGSIGFQGTYLDDLTIGTFISFENTGHGFALGNIDRLTTGTLHAYNNNVGDDGTSDNVFLDTVTNGAIGGILAVDDRGTKLVHRGLHAISSDNIAFGPIQVNGAVDTTFPIYVDPANCTGITYSNDIGFVITFASTDTTPSVAGCNLFKTSNGSPTTITMFDNGYIEQKIHVIIGDPDTTIDFTGTNLKGNGGVDWAAGQGDWLEAVFDGTNWYCTVNEI